METISEHKYIGNVQFSTQKIRGGERKLFVDFGLPDSKAWPGLRPVIIFIHGGTWVGDRIQENLPWRYVDEYGFAVARFDYRTAYEAPFPAQVADCRSVVRFIRKHAAEYNIDPWKIGVRGASAGAQLSSMLGVGDGAEGLDNPNDDTSVSVAVQAVVDDFGPTDILGLWKLMDLFDQYLRASPCSNERKQLKEKILMSPDAQRSELRRFLDGPWKMLTNIPGIRALVAKFKHPCNYMNVARYLSGWEDGSALILKDEELLQRVSPIQYLTGPYRKDGRRVPPFRVLHGEEDCCVPFNQSKIFVEELRKVGTDVEFDTDCGGRGHFPSGEHWWNVLMPKEAAFFKRNLQA